MPPLQLQMHTSTATLVTAGALLTGTAFVVFRLRLQAARPCRNAEDLHRNSSAKGSEVVEIYRERIPKDGFIIITGASSGIGRQVALLLGKTGANLILAVRNVCEGEAVKTEITEQADLPGTIYIWRLDLMSLESVQAFATKFRETFGTSNILTGLVNNAGVYGIKGKTVDDFQITWQTNALAPALLTELLLPSMTEDARIVNVSSEMGKMVWRIKEHCPPKKSGSATWDYALSKACQVLHAHELSLRFQNESLLQRRAMAVEPGLIQTRIARHSGTLANFINYKVVGPVLMRTIDQGCSTTLFCLLAPDSDLAKGAKNSNAPTYYYANCAPSRPSTCCASLDEVRAQADLFASIFGKYTQEVD